MSWAAIIAHLVPSPWLERLGWTLLHFLWQGVLVAAAQAMALAGLRHRSARARYLVGLTAVMAALLFPLATFLALPANVTPPRALAPRQSGALPGMIFPRQAGSFLPAATPSSVVAAERPPTAAGEHRRVPASWLIRLAAGVRHNYGTLAARAVPWLPWCAALWAVGVALLSLRLLAGWRQVRWLCRQGAPPADPLWQTRLEALARRMGIGRAVRLLESTLAEVPAVIGVLRPVILLPIGMVTGLGTAQVEMILAHELAHVQRQDYLVNLGLTLFETLGFYHPATWWIAARVREEREHACDDLAVRASGSDRLGYARTLATLEEMRGPMTGVTLAATSGGRGLLLARVRRLLGVEAVPSRRLQARRAAGSLAGALALMVTGALILGGVQRPARAQETAKEPPKALAAAPPAVEMLTARVKIVDEAGRPIAGATVTPDGLRTLAEPSGHYSWRTTQYGPPVPATTAADGVATVLYPRYTDEKLATGAISFRAEHPDYCPVRPTNYAVTDDPARAEPVALRRGATLRITGHLPGASTAVPIYPQQEDPTHDSLTANSWRDAGGNALETRQLPPGRNYLRLAHAESDGSVFFSDTTLLSAVPGETHTLDLELKPGVRAEGRLDPSVPRPVRGGRVMAHAYATGPESDAKWVAWYSWRDVAADGTFVFESLPPGALEVTALCKGYTSTGGPDPRFGDTSTAPQQFALTAGETTHAELKMQAAAVCTVEVHDEVGAPVSGARVSLAPSVHWTPGMSTIFGMPMLKMEELARSWREYKSSFDWLRDNPYQAMTDARGIATVRNLPAQKGTYFGVIDDRHATFPAHFNSGKDKVDLAPGRTATATVFLKKKGTSVPSDEETATTATPAPAASSPTPAPRPMGASSADFALAVRQSPEAPDTFSGRVVDEDGEPLPGVLVDAWTWCPGSEATTDADGKFALAGLDPKRQIEVRFSKADHTPRLIVKQPLGALIQPLALTRHTYFEGVITGPDGQPAADAWIRANQGPKEADDVQIGEIWTETHADAQGRYRLYAQDDRYDIQVTTKEGNVARLPETDLIDGQARRLDIKLQAGVLFRAKVVDAGSGLPVAGAILSNGEHPGAEGVSGVDGTLEIRGLLPGRFQFEVAAEGYARWWSEQCADEWSRFQRESSPGAHWQRNFDSLDFDLQRDMNQVTVSLERGVRIRGRALDPDGQPVAGATVAPAHTGTGNSLTGDTRYSVKTRADGAFDLLLPASKESEYNLMVHDGKYGEWRRWANGVLPPIRTQPGQTLDAVEIRLSRPAVARGRVTNARGQPIAGKDVRAQAADRLENRYYDPTVTTDRDGRFELKFMRPGKQVIQVEPFWLDAREAPAGTSRTVDLPAGGTEEGIDLHEPDAGGSAGSPVTGNVPAPGQKQELHGMVRDEAGSGHRRRGDGNLQGWNGPYGPLMKGRLPFSPC